MATIDANSGPELGSDVLLEEAGSENLLWLRESYCGRDSGHADGVNEDSDNANSDVDIDDDRTNSDDDNNPVWKKYSFQKDVYFWLKFVFCARFKKNP